MILVFLDNIGYTAADNIGVNRLSYPESIHIIRVLSVNRVRPRHIKHALENGNRLFMMHRGQILVDIKGEEKEKLDNNKLLGLFEKANGADALNDRTLFG